MAQPKFPKHANSNSYSNSALSVNDQNQYFHRSSLNKSGFTTSHKESKKMGSIKKWFARLGSSTKMSADDEQKAHTDIEHRIANESKLETRTVSLLLLGAGGSGKSTVLKQMERIHNADKYDQDEKELQKTISEVHKNIVLDIHDLCRHYYKLKQQDADIKFASSDIETLVMQIASNDTIGLIPTLNMDFARQIAEIWNTDIMKKVFSIRKKSHIMDNTPYFLDNVEKYAHPQYVMTFDDYVRLRDQTTGIMTTSFLVQSKAGECIFNMTDVGGQRAERRKWIRVFSGIDVVLYVMSLSSYDQVLYEDHNTRCFDETLQLFEKTSGDRAFKKTDFIVFLNKNDIFKRKIKEIPFTVYKEDFDEKKAHDAQSVINWIRHQFITRFEGEHVINDIQNGIMNAQNKSNIKKSSKRGVHFHVTCATDTDQITAVVGYVQLELMRRLMTKAALF